MQHFLMHILSRVLVEEKKGGTFVQYGAMGLHCVHTVFVPVFQCHALKRYRPIDKKVQPFMLH